MNDTTIGKITLTAAGFQKLMKITGQSEEEVRRAAEQNGFVVEPLPKPSSTGMYL